MRVGLKGWLPLTDRELGGVGVAPNPSQNILTQRDIRGVFGDRAAHEKSQQLAGYWLEAPRVGLEQSSNNQVSDSITMIPKTGGAQSGAPGARDTDLDTLIKAWSKLPKGVQKRIMVLAGIESDTE